MNEIFFHQSHEKEKNEKLFLAHIYVQVLFKWPEHKSYTVQSEAIFHVVAY